MTLKTITRSMGEVLLALGIWVAGFDASLSMLSACKNMYGASSRDWLRSKRYPQEIGSGIRSPNIWIVNDTILGRFAVHHQTYASARRESVAGQQSFWRQALVYTLYSIGEALKVQTLVQSLTTPVQGKAISGETCLVTIEDGQVASAVGMFFPVPESERRSIDIFTIAHEFRHCDQPHANDFIDESGNEGDADYYATQKTLEITGDVQAIQDIKDFRSIASALPPEYGGGDVVHGTALFIEAARQNKPEPDRIATAKANIALASFFTAVARMTRAEGLDAMQGKIMNDPQIGKTVQELIQSPEGTEAFLALGQAEVRALNNMKELFQPRRSLPMP